MQQWVAASNQNASKKDHVRSHVHVEKEKCKQWRHVEKTVEFVMNLFHPNTEERYLQKLLKYFLK